MAILKMNSTSNIIWQSVYNYQPLIKGLTVDSTETYFYVAWAPAAVIISHTSTGVIYQSFYKIRNLNININKIWDPLIFAAWNEGYLIYIFIKKLHHSLW